MKKKTKFNEKKIKDLAEKGFTLKEISKTLDYNISSLYSFCKSKNIEYKKSKRGGGNFIDMSGKKYHDITVIEKSGYIDGTSIVVWKCLCPCGSIFTSRGADIRQGKVKTCGCRTNIKNRRNWNGYKEISKSYWQQVVSGAKQRFIEFDISIEYVWSIYIKQDRKCILSGESVSFSSNGRNQTASIDRIDNNLGYIEGNIQITHKTVNKIKSNMTNDEIINWSNRICKYNEYKKSI